MVEHELKTEQPFYDDVYYRYKGFEVRKHDRDFKVGHIVKLNEFVNGCLTGSFVRGVIKYILTHEQFPEGIKPGYCILGIDFKEFN